MYKKTEDKTDLHVFFVEKNVLISDHPCHLIIVSRKFVGKTLVGQSLALLKVLTVVIVSVW